MVENTSKTRIEIEYKPMRDEMGRILPGQPPLNPKGRPAQKTMKEYAREWFLQLSNEEKTAYLTNLEKVRPGFAWTMSEGNPTEDKNITIKVPTPILGGSSQAITMLENGEDKPLIDETTPPQTTSDTPHV